MRRKTKEEWIDKHRHVARKLVLEGGLGARKEFSTLVGQMTANATLVTKRKEKKHTGFTILQVGMKSGARSRRDAGSGDTNRGDQRRNGSGKEVL